MPPNTRATRCRCRWRSASSGSWASAAGATITRRNWHCSKSWRRIGPKIGGFSGYLGWARIETGAVAAGTRLVERSLALNPRNAHGAHQRAHGYFEMGDSEGGAAFIEDWLAGLRARRPSALPSVVASGAVRAGARQQRARDGDSTRCDPAGGRVVGADAEPRRFGVVSVALAALRRDADAGRRLGGGRGPCPPAFSAGKPGLCRSARRLAEAATGDDEAAARPHRRAAGSGAGGEIAAGRGRRRRCARGSSAGARRSRRGRPQCSKPHSATCRASAAATPSARSSRIP